MRVLVIGDHPDPGGAAFASRQEQRFTDAANTFDDPDDARAEPAGISNEPPAVGSSHSHNTSSPGRSGGDPEPDSDSSAARSSNE